MLPIYSDRTKFIVAFTIELSFSLSIQTRPRTMLFTLENILSNPECCCLCKRILPIPIYTIRTKNIAGYIREHSLYNQKEPRMLFKKLEDTTYLPKMA